MDCKILINFLAILLPVFASCITTGKLSVQKPDLNTEINQLITNMVPEFIEGVSSNELHMDRIEHIEGAFSVNDSGQISNCRIITDPNWSVHLSSALNEKRIKAVEASIKIFVSFALNKREGLDYGIESMNVIKKSERDKFEIMNEVSKHMEEITYLYSKRLVQNPDIRGKVTAAFKIDENGRVAEAIIQSSTVNDPTFDSTIVNRVKTWVFKASGEVPYDTTEVVYPFMFTK